MIHIDFQNGSGLVLVPELVTTILEKASDGKVVNIERLYELTSPPVYHALYNRWASTQQNIAPTVNDHFSGDSDLLESLATGNYALDIDGIPMEVPSSPFEAPDKLNVVPPAVEDATLLWPVKDIHAGATVLMGGSGSGKTFYLTQDLSPDVLIRFGEPKEHLVTDAFICTPRTLQHTMLFAFVAGLSGYKVAIDSLRFLFYGLTGAAATGGVIAKIFNLMTDLGNFFTHAGTNVLLVVNPLAAKEAYELLYNNTMGSTTGVLWMDNHKLSKQSARTTSGRIIDVEVDPEDRPTPRSYYNGAKRVDAVTDDMGSKASSSFADKIDALEDKTPAKRVHSDFIGDI